MYAVTILNTDEHIDELEALGIKLSYGFSKTTTYLQIQLNVNVCVSTVMYDEIYSPLVNIEDISPLMLLTDTRSRIEYLHAYAYYNLDQYLMAVQIDEQNV